MAEHALAGRTVEEALEKDTEDAERDQYERAQVLLHRPARDVGLPLSADWLRLWAAEDHAKAPPSTSP